MASEPPSKTPQRPRRTSSSSGPHHHTAHTTPGGSSESVSSHLHVDPQQTSSSPSLARQFTDLPGLEQMKESYQRFEDQVFEFQENVEERFNEFAQSLQELKNIKDKLPIPLAPAHPNLRNAIYHGYKAYRAKPTLPFSLLATVIAVTWIILAFFNLVPTPIPVTYLLSAYVLLEIGFYFVYRSRLKQFQGYSSAVSHSDQNTVAGRSRVFGNMLSSLSLDKYGDTKDVSFFFRLWFLSPPVENPHAVFEVVNALDEKNALANNNHDNPNNPTSTASRTLSMIATIQDKIKNIHLPELSRGNVLQWVSWALYSRFPNQLSLDEAQECSNYVNLVQRLCPTLEFKPGLNHHQKSMRLSLEALGESMHHTLFYYYVVSGVQTATQLILHYYMGFERKQIGSHYYWYRSRCKNILYNTARGQNNDAEIEHAFNDRSVSPIVLLHGVGHGIVYYLNFLSKLTYTDVFLVELPFISNRFFETPAQSDSIVTVIDTMLCEHNFSKAIFCGHSFGTFACAWVLKYKPHIVQSVFLLDPVALLLCIPTTCYQFMYSPTENLMDLVRKVISSELTLVAVMRRAFYWSDMSLFLQDLPQVVMKINSLLHNPMQFEHYKTQQHHLQQSSSNSYNKSQNSPTFVSRLPSINIHCPNNPTSTSTATPIPSFLPSLPSSTVQTSKILNNINNPGIDCFDDISLDGSTVMVHNRVTNNTHNNDGGGSNDDDNNNNDVLTSSQPSFSSSQQNDKNIKKHITGAFKDTLQLKCRYDYAYYPGHTPQSQLPLGLYCECNTGHSNFHVLEHNCSKILSDNPNYYHAAAKRQNIMSRGNLGDNLLPLTEKEAYDQFVYKTLGFIPSPNEIDVYGCFDAIQQPDVTYSNYLEVSIGKNAHSDIDDFVSISTENRTDEKPSDEHSPQSNAVDITISKNGDKDESVETVDPQTCLAKASQPHSDIFAENTDAVTTQSVKLIRQVIPTTHAVNLKHWQLRPDGSLDMNVYTKPHSTKLLTPQQQCLATNDLEILKNRDALLSQKGQTQHHSPTIKNGQKNNNTINDEKDNDSPVIMQHLSSYTAEEYFGGSFDDSPLDNSSNLLHIPNVSGPFVYPPVSSTFTDHHCIDHKTDSNSNNQIDIAKQSVFLPTCSNLNTPQQQLHLPDPAVLSSLSLKKASDYGESPALSSSLSGMSTNSLKNAHNNMSLNLEHLPQGDNNDNNNTNLNASSPHDGHNIPHICHLESTATSSLTRRTGPSGTTSSSSLLSLEVSTSNHAQSHHHTSTTTPLQHHTAAFSPHPSALFSPHPPILSPTTSTRPIATITESGINTNVKSASGVGLFNVRQKLPCGCLTQCVCGLNPYHTQDTSNVFQTTTGLYNNSENRYHMVYDRESSEIFLPNHESYHLAQNSVSGTINNPYSFNGNLQFNGDDNNPSQQWSQPQFQPPYHQSSHLAHEYGLAQPVLPQDLSQSQQHAQQSTHVNNAVMALPTQQVKMAVLLGGLDDLVPVDRIVRHLRLYYELLHGKDIQQYKNQIFNQKYRGGKKLPNATPNHPEKMNIHTEYTHTHYHQFEHNTTISGHTQTINEINEQSSLLAKNINNELSHQIGAILQTSDIHINNVYAKKPRKETKIQGDLLAALEHGLVARYNDDSLIESVYIKEHENDQQLTALRQQENFLQKQQQNTPFSPYNRSQLVQNTLISPHYNNTSIQSPQNTQTQHKQSRKNYHTSLSQLIRTRVLFNPSGTHASFLLEDKSHVYEMFDWLSQP